MEEQATYDRVTRVRNTEYVTSSDGTEWKRKVNKDGTRTAWEAASPPLPAVQPEATPLLMLVLENQAKGEPAHWSLFVAREGETGSVYQVKGDATFMTYTCTRDVDLLGSPDYRTSYILASLDQQAIVERCAESQPPPQAPDRRSVTENCQGWTVRVLRSLQLAGVVDERWITFAEGLQEPV